MQNKASPDAHPISYPFPTPALTNRVQMPMPREFNGKKYYGAADVAKIIGVIILQNAASCAKINSTRKKLATDSTLNYISEPPKEVPFLMDNSHDNKSAPKNQGGTSKKQTKSSCPTHVPPLPRTFEGKLYYGAADVAKIIGVTKQAVIIAKRLPI